VGQRTMRTGPGRPPETTPTRSGQAVGVLVADPQTVVVEGLRSLLGGHRSLRFVGAARTGAEAVRLAEVLQPDVAVVELHFPGRPSGVQLVQGLLSSCPRLGVVVFSDAAAQALVPRLLAAGASAFVPKDTPPEVLAHAILTVAAGGAAVLTPSASALSGPFRLLSASGLPPGEPQLTARERQYLQLLAEGLTDAQIARRLHTARATVRSQLGRLYRKLGARNRAQALARALVLGL